VKTLFILPEYYPHSGAGISTYYLHYIKALEPFCEKIKVIVGSGYVFKEDKYTIGNVEIEYLTPGNFRSYLDKFSNFDLLPEFKNNLAASWAMYDQAEQGKGFDIVECTDFGLGFVPWITRRRIPVITRLHGSTGQIYMNDLNSAGNLCGDFFRQTELLLLPLCDRLITHSANNQHFWENALKVRVKLIDPIYLNNAPPPLPLSQREHYGLVCARLQKWKGPEMLSNAIMATKIQNHIPIKWVGREMQFEHGQPALKFLKTRYPGVWGHHIMHHPPVDNTAIAEMQAKAKFGVVPSTWDMFNFSCVEFMSAGTPVICSDGAGASTLINNGENGFCYPAENADALADHLEKFISMTIGEYNQMASAAATTIKKRLSPERLLASNMEEYETILQNMGENAPAQFLAGIYEPTAQLHRIDDILDKVALKPLASYVINRAGRKLRIKR
jgi:glycosyltransferase involved in cell wall biosynthesis